MAAFSIKDFCNDCMDRKQNMAMLLHRMKQLNELDHTELSWKYWYNPWALFETAEQTDERYATQKLDRKAQEERSARNQTYYDSYEGTRARKEYENSREREHQRAIDNGTARY